MLTGKKVLLVIGGGISAFKSIDLLRLIQKQGGSVTVVLTKAAQQFVTPLTVSALSGNKVYDDLFNLDDEAEMGHIELSRAADLVVVAPATADLIGKMAGGLANDLASTLLMATDKKVLIAPAMNVRMWEHPATQRNIATLGNDGVLTVGPDEGEMACGEFGFGRMAEPVDILNAVIANLREGPLTGRNILVTSGPTHEPIDPVRYIANRSSGKQGSAIANALLALGANVTFVTGPAIAARPVGARVIEVETAAEMMEAVDRLDNLDAAIFAAAVADWRVLSASNNKIKKQNGALPVLEFTENPDILMTISRRSKNRPGLVIGFAAETENVVANAKAKLARKGCDWIVANDVAPETGIMGGAENAVILITADGQEEWPRMGKDQVAVALAGRIAKEIT